MENKTLTAEQLREAFPTEMTEETKQAVYDRWQERMTMEATADIAASIIEHTRRDAGTEVDGWNQFDRTLWTIKEAYIFGVLEGLEIAATANQQVINELFGKEVTA